MKKSYLWIGIAIVVIAILLGWGKIAGTTKPLTFWNGTEVQCLPNGHENLAMHIHQNLLITVDGTKAEVPGNIGIAKDCMAEVHTHDATGKIHEESVMSGKKFALKDFFTVWGTPLSRDGYTLTAMVNGAIQADPTAIELIDGQTIELNYTSADVNGTSTEAVL